MSRRRRRAYIIWQSPAGAPPSDDTYKTDDAETDIYYTDDAQTEPLLNEDP